MQHNDNGVVGMLAYGGDDGRIFLLLPKPPSDYSSSGGTQRNANCPLAQRSLQTQHWEGVIGVGQILALTCLAALLVTLVPTNYNMS